MKHFKLTEFNCKCGCRANEMQQQFLELLDALREQCGFSFQITSGYRCENHNRKEGGTKSSAHLTGWAADIFCANSWNRWQIITCAMRLGVKRIGIANIFVHVDMDPEKPKETIWTY